MENTHKTTGDKNIKSVLARYLSWLALIVWKITKGLKVVKINNKNPKSFGKRPHRCLVTSYDGEYICRPRLCSKQAHSSMAAFTRRYVIMGRIMFPLKSDPSRGGPGPLSNMPTWFL